MKIGILGTGTIASAIVTGFCTKKSGYEFFLSPRNAEKAAALAAKFPDVKVCTSNQEVLNNAECIFITVQKNAFGALNELKFQKNHKVLNMATEMRLDDLKSLIGETEILAHVVPLPMIVRGFGPLLVYPKAPEIGELFAPVADALYVNDLKDIRSLQLLTCIMSPYYMLMNEIVEFSVAQGIDHELSIKFVHSLFSALSRRATETPNCDIIELANDMTPGGYNEQAMNELLNNGAIKAWHNALNSLSKRLHENLK